RAARPARTRRPGRGGAGANALPLTDRAPPDTARSHPALPRPLLGVGLRAWPVRASGIDDRFRASQQPRTPGRRRGFLRRGAAARHAARARAAGSDRRGQPLWCGDDGGVTAPVRLGLRENLGQFSLLVAVNVFVGAMVGLERSTLPLVARVDFGVTSAAAVLSFIVGFGLAKAFTNLAAGALADRIGRRRLLLVGWLAALPVPLLIAPAPSMARVVVANVFARPNQ